MTQVVSSEIQLSDNLRVPQNPKMLEQIRRAQRISSRRRAIQCNTKASKARCDGGLRKF